ncbi:MAG: hypothetical protein E5Y73_11845 [Mesorhizobium sp.]|uniref:hypothetical protein n=1 Tax=Mesorhizobium sp. TaxID=1871066 RepID=UPI00120A5B52|nr:hypothetical protein [Mesorhizobium sp.]TIL94411.1 MAG: hypothetical protein E5Y73_11845 [Mesorhizobium sp.]
MSGRFGSAEAIKVPRVEAALSFSPVRELTRTMVVRQVQFAGKAAPALEPASLAGDGDGALLDAAIASTERPFTQTK